MEAITELMSAPPQNNQQFQNASDRELLVQFVAERDQGAFSLLVSRHGPLVWSVCQRILRSKQDREDVFQATFLELVVQANRNQWHETIGGWLYRVAYRLSLKARATQLSRRETEFVVEPYVTANDWEIIQRQDAENALHAAISRLPAREREVIVLCCLQNKSREEAAEEIGCTLLAIKARLQRARRRLALGMRRQGLPLAVTLVAMQRTLEAAPVTIPASLLEKTITVGVGAAAGGSGQLGLLKAFAHEKLASAFDSAIVGKSLLTAGCFAMFGLAAVGFVDGLRGLAMVPAIPGLSHRHDSRTETVEPTFVVPELPAGHKLCSNCTPQQNPEPQDLIATFSDPHQLAALPAHRIPRGKQPQRHIGLVPLLSKIEKPAAGSVHGERRPRHEVVKHTGTTEKTEQPPSPERPGARTTCCS